MSEHGSELCEKEVDRKTKGRAPLRVTLKLLACLVYKAIGRLSILMPRSGFTAAGLTIRLWTVSKQDLH